jgi:hypothetical protein
MELTFTKIPNKWFHYLTSISTFIFDINARPISEKLYYIIYFSKNGI